MVLPITSMIDWLAHLYTDSGNHTDKCHVLYSYITKVQVTIALWLYFLLFWTFKEGLRTVHFYMYIMINMKRVFLHKFRTDTIIYNSTDHTPLLAITTTDIIGSVFTIPTIVLPIALSILVSSVLIPIAIQ